MTTPSGNDVGFLIEAQKADCGPVWACCPNPGHWLFTANHLEAVRFARREDADQVRRTFFPGDQIKTIEHGWESERNKPLGHDDAEQGMKP